MRQEEAKLARRLAIIIKKFENARSFEASSEALDEILVTTELLRGFRSPSLDQVAESGINQTARSLMRRAEAELKETTSRKIAMQWWSDGQKLRQSGYRLPENFGHDVSERAQKVFLRRTIEKLASADRRSPETPLFKADKLAPQLRRNPVSSAGLHLASREYRPA